MTLKMAGFKVCWRRLTAPPPCRHSSLQCVKTTDGQPGACVWLRSAALYPLAVWPDSLSGLRPLWSPVSCPVEHVPTTLKYTLQPDPVVQLCSHTDAEIIFTIFVILKIIIWILVSTLLVPVSPVAMILIRNISKCVKNRFCTLHISFDVMVP